MTAPDDAPPADHGTPDRPLAGMRQLGVPVVELTAELAERRAAVGELGAALREVSAAAIRSEVDVAELRRVAAEAGRLAEALAARQRRVDEPAQVDDLARGQRPFNPVVGAGNPVAPPLRIEFVDGAAVGWCALDGRYEGPFTYAHGGVSALLLDQLMGYAAAMAGHPGVTGRLQVRYRSAVPLHEPLRLDARLVDVLGVRAAVHGSIALASAPDDPLVEAEGSFLALRPEQAERLFGERRTRPGSD